ncbi:hypothetical protein VPH35_036677 [Triticum aestivum]
MALPLHCHLTSMFFQLPFLSMVFVDTNFTVSEAAYYPNSDTKGIEKILLLVSDKYFQMEHVSGTFQATLNNFNVSASASLYRNGVGCNVPTHAIGSICGGAPGCVNHNTIFLFRPMAQSADGGEALLALGRVELNTGDCEPDMPTGPLSIRMLFSSRASRSGDQKWLVLTNIILPPFHNVERSRFPRSKFDHKFNQRDQLQWEQKYEFSGMIFAPAAVGLVG